MEEIEKKPSGFKKVLKKIFIHNIHFKLLALGISVLMWMIITGL